MCSSRFCNGQILDPNILEWLHSDHAGNRTTLVRNRSSIWQSPSHNPSGKAEGGAVSGYEKIVSGSGVGLGTFRNRVDGWLERDEDGEMVGSTEANDDGFSVGSADAVDDGYVYENIPSNRQIQRRRRRRRPLFIIVLVVDVVVLFSFSFLSSSSFVLLSDIVAPRVLLLLLSWVFFIVLVCNVNNNNNKIGKNRYSMT